MVNSRPGMNTISGRGTILVPDRLTLRAMLMCSQQLTAMLNDRAPVGEGARLSNSYSVTNRSGVLRRL